MTARASFNRRRRRLWLLAAATAASFAATVPSSQRMKNLGADIFAFELISTPEQAEAVLRAWGDAGRSAAHQSLELDFLLIASYGTWFSAWGRYLSDRAGELGHERTAALGQIASRAAVTAAGLDVIENLALLKILRGDTRQPYPAIAGRAAGAKFANLLVLVIPSVLIGGAYVWLVGLKSRCRQVHAGPR
jgi:hypothetical protein